MTSNASTENAEYDIPSHILKTIFGLHASVILSCDQAALKHFSPSVRPSRRLSVSVLLPMAEVTSMQKVKGRGQMSRSQRSKLNLAISRL